MPVTFKVASHEASTHPLNRDASHPAAGTETIFLRQATGDLHGRLLQSSLASRDPATVHLIPSKNGFVHSLIDAYAHHYHLRIRPDDVWLAILTQLSFYVNAHAEEPRQYFVSHDGQRRLDIKGSFDCESMARKFAAKIHENVADSTLAEWILPDFTTTTIHDRTVCSVVMMSTLKAYFSYHSRIICGIPSVTLDGTKSDWEEIYYRTYRLYDLGAEPSAWAEMLRPILDRFISAFDGEPDIEFWNHVLYRRRERCGQNDLGGWITAFCVWSPNGKWLMRTTPDVIPQKPVPPPRPIRAASAWTEETGTLSWRGSGKFARVCLSKVTTQMRRLIDTGIKKRDKTTSFVATASTEEHQAADTDTVTATDIESELNLQSPVNGSKLERIGRLTISGGPRKNTLEGMRFPIIDFNDIPNGYCEVDVILHNHALSTTCKMLAGHLAYSVSSKDPEGPLNTIQPSSHWFLVN